MKLRDARRTIGFRAADASPLTSPLDQAAVSECEFELYRVDLDYVGCYESQPCHGKTTILQKRLKQGSSQMHWYSEAKSGNWKYIGNKGLDSLFSRWTRAVGRWYRFVNKDIK